MRATVLVQRPKIETLLEKLTDPDVVARAVRAKMDLLQERDHLTDEEVAEFIDGADIAEEFRVMVTAAMEAGGESWADALELLVVKLAAQMGEMLSLLSWYRRFPIIGKRAGHLLAQYEPDGEAPPLNVTRGERVNGR